MTEESRKLSFVARDTDHLSRFHSRPDRTPDALQWAYNFIDGAPVITPVEQPAPADPLVFHGPPPGKIDPKDMPYMSWSALVVFDHALSDVPRPIWRPWYRRLADWLCRRPVPIMSEREQVTSQLLDLHQAKDP